MIGTAYAGYPYWPEYSKTPLAEIRPQKWRDKDDVIEGWDWSPYPPEESRSA